jgi:hypothetical protein
VPKFVERELRGVLECGALACGFLRLQCELCKEEKLLPFSCKGRAACSSCCGRRMADTAAHLVDHVFPRVPVRQWVLSLHFSLRYRLAYSPSLLTAVYGIFARTVFSFLRKMGRDYGIHQTQCGAVSFVQRYGGSLNLNVHIHMACIDGVYAPDVDGRPRFYALRRLEDKDIPQLTKRWHLKSRRWFSTGSENLVARRPAVARATVAGWTLCGFGLEPDCRRPQCRPARHAGRKPDRSRED